jgi:metal-responsive CopG/Arc/MetJ family transcriptional regulator
VEVETVKLSAPNPRGRGGKVAGKRQDRQPERKRKAAHGRGYVVSALVNQDLIDRLDVLVAKTGENRSIVINRLLGRSLEEYEWWVGTFSNPLIRETVARVAENAALVKKILSLVGEEMTDEEIEERSAIVRRLRREAKGDPRQNEAMKPLLT